MSYLLNILVLAGVWFSAMIIPGPDFAATVQYATAYSRRDGILVALGITSAIGVWIIGSMAGLAILFARFSWIVVIMRIGGAVFLAYLGIATIIQARRTSKSASMSPTPPPPQTPEKSIMVRSLSRSLSGISIPPELFGTHALSRVMSYEKSLAKSRSSGSLRRINLVPYNEIAISKVSVDNKQKAIAGILSSDDKQKIMVGALSSDDRQKIMASLLSSDSEYMHAEAEKKRITRSALSSWRVGFLTNIGNPKAVVFFSSLFVVILPPNPPLGVQAASFVVMMLISASWYCIVACFFSMGPIIKIYQRAKLWIDYFTGFIFVALAVSLVLER